ARRRHLSRRLGLVAREVRAQPEVSGDDQATLLETAREPFDGYSCSATARHPFLPGFPRKSLYISWARIAGLVARRVLQSTSNEGVGHGLREGMEEDRCSHRHRRRRRRLRLVQPEERSVALEALGAPDAARRGASVGVIPVLEGRLRKRVRAS